jgi:hypothetical protein
MSYARWSAVVLAALVMAGCGGQDEPSQAGPVAESSTSTATAAATPTPTPRPTPIPVPTPTPTKAPPKAPAADCTGSFKNGTFSFSGREIFMTDGFFSCAGGELIGYERRKTSLRFSYGSKSVTVAAGKSAKFAGYRIRVGLANAKQATFTLDVLSRG